MCALNAFPFSLPLLGTGECILVLWIKRQKGKGIEKSRSNHEGAGGVRSMFFFLSLLVKQLPVPEPYLLYIHMNGCTSWHSAQFFCWPQPKLITSLGYDFLPPQAWLPVASNDADRHASIAVSLNGDTACQLSNKPHNIWNTRGQAQISLFLLPVFCWLLVWLSKLHFPADTANVYIEGSRFLYQHHAWWGQSLVSKITVSYFLSAVRVLTEK